MKPTKRMKVISLQWLAGILLLSGIGVGLVGGYVVAIGLVCMAAMAIGVAFDIDHQPIHEDPNLFLFLKKSHGQGRRLA